MFEVDEHPRPKTTMEILSKLPPVFKKGGTVTAGNASVSSLFYTQNRNEICDMGFVVRKPGLKAIKLFMLNSTKHEIYHAHEC